MNGDEDKNQKVRPDAEDGLIDNDEVVKAVEKEKSEAGFEDLQDEPMESKFVEDGLDGLENDPTDPAEPTSSSMSKPTAKTTKPIIDHDDGILDKIENFFHQIWSNKKYRNGSIAAVFFIILFTLAIPPVRYFALNMVGVRVQASMFIVDKSTNQPLKNVDVWLSGKSAKTNDDGYVEFKELKLGPSSISIERRAFAKMEVDHIIGWGDNKLGDFLLDPIGLQYTFFVSDFLGEQPVVKAEASSGDISAFSNEKGELVVTTDQTTDPDNFTIQASGYKTETLKPTSEAQNIKMVPAKKHIYASKRSGRLDVYSIYADGSEDEILLKGTGSEIDDMSISTHPTKDFSAVVSTRNNQRNSDGYPLSTLTLIDVGTGKINEIDVAENLIVIGWADKSLVYVKSIAGASENNPNRQKVLAFNIESFESTELASSNYFNDVAIANGRVYYAPSSAFQKGVNVSLFAVNPDGTNKQVVLLEEVWRLIRTKLNQFTIAVGQAWYKYDIGSQKEPIVINGVPEQDDSISFVPDVSGQKFLYSNIRDDKGVLLWMDQQNQKENVIISDKGLAGPYYWLNSTSAVYRVDNNEETADYVVSTINNKNLKISDVTNTNSIDNWYRH